MKLKDIPKNIEDEVIECLLGYKEHNSMSSIRSFFRLFGIPMKTENLSKVKEIMGNLIKEIES